MTEQQQDPLEERYQRESGLIARAWSDPAFRQALLANPKAVIEKELGIRLPAGFEVRVLEDSALVYHLVIPRNPAGEGELADFELEGVVGG